MALIQDVCTCSVADCECPSMLNKTETWVDKITSKCRDCELKHDLRWGPPNPSGGLRV